jgi:hypothetical protein
MQDDETTVSGFCRHCWCNEPQAAAAAKALDFQEQFQAGIYTCCQIVQWADEQWLAWLEAASEDRKMHEEITRPLETSESETGVFRAHSGDSRLKRRWFGDLRP